MTLPKIAHRVWLRDSMPQRFTEYGDAFREQNPGWKLIEWYHPAGLPDMPPAVTDVFGRASEFYPRDWRRFESDIARLVILHAVGGFYLDCDVEPLRPLDGLVDQLAIDSMAQVFLAGRSPQSIRRVNPITNAVMAATPRHPFVGALLDGLPDAVAEHGHLPLARSVGPWHLHRTFVAGEWPTVVVVPPDVLYGDDSVLRHHWSNRKRRRRLAGWRF